MKIGLALYTSAEIRNESKYLIDFSDDMKNPTS